MIQITATLTGHQLKLSNGAVMIDSRVIVPTNSVNIDEISIVKIGTDWDGYPVFKAVFWRDDAIGEVAEVSIVNDRFTIPRSVIQTPGLINVSLYAATSEGQGSRVAKRITSNAAQILVEQGPILT